ncbi:hypothetical protein [Streptomyces sp. NPDC002287]
MSTSTEQMQAADRLWQEHRHEPFPDGLRRAAPGGTDVWLLELDIAGCVLRWFDDGGTPDAQRSSFLRSCVEDLGRVIPELDDPAAAAYCRRLRRLAVLVSGDLTLTP